MAVTSPPEYCSRADVVARLTQHGVNWLLRKTSDTGPTEADYVAAVDQNIVWAGGRIDSRVGQQIKLEYVRAQAVPRLRDLAIDIASYRAAGYGSEYVDEKSPLAIAFQIALDEVDTYSSALIPGLVYPPAVDTGMYIERTPQIVGGLQRSARQFRRRGPFYGGGYGGGPISR